MDQKKSAAGTPISQTTKSDPDHKTFFLDRHTVSEFDEVWAKGEHSFSDGIVLKKKMIGVSRVVS